jgi:cysteine desulfurase/selenocysteine lyase
MDGSGRAEAEVRRSGGERLDPARIRGDFPVLARSVRGRPLVYLDNAATTHKPRAVIEAMSRFYETSNSNVHRGVHALSEEATAAFESARESARRFIGAADTSEVVFVRGTTEAINLVALSYGGKVIGPGEEILMTGMEHHSNIVPWQMLCRQVGAKLSVVPVTDEGELRLEDVERLVGDKTRIVAVVHTSNALGTVNPVREIVEIAHRRGAAVVVDGAQAVAHASVDVSELGCDFFAFSGHKMYGPSGIGVLWGRGELLERMPPWQGGGEMIRSVTFEETTFSDIPYRFEAGTPHIAGAVGLAAAIHYIEGIGPASIARHEAELLAEATRRVGGMPRVRLIGTARRKVAVLSFVVDGVHPHDLGTVLDAEGVAVRTGHHCAQPLMERFGVPATVRASFAMYNLREEIDALAEALDKAVRLLG